MRMNLGCYGDNVAVTPNIDKLASRSLLFTRAYCQFASCNASRASVITGQRPDTISVWKLNTHFRDTAPDVVTMPQHFKANGYHTEAIGKVLHNYGAKQKDDALSWSTPARLDKISHFKDYAQDSNIPKGSAKKTIVAEKPVNEDHAYVDEKITKDAVETIKRLAEQDVPFFLAVGFIKPHSPYNAPKEYWDLYQREDMKALCSETRPEGVPDLNWWDSIEIRGFTDIPNKGPIPTETAARMRHGYYAATSYADANIGKVINALETSGAADNTIIVFWSDHGYHLGENGHWAKVTLRELDAQVPLLISLPSKESANTNAIVEYIDLYPTLSELCSLPQPTDIDGKSFVPVLENPKSEFRQTALTQVCRPWSPNAPIETMGYSIRTADYRYTQWIDHNSKAMVSEELYELEKDPFQRVNVAKMSESGDTLFTHRALLNSANSRN